MLAKKCANRFGRIADRNGIDLHAPSAEFGKDARLADARPAPARKNVQQPRLARRQVRGFEAGLSRNRSPQRERRHFALDKLRRNGRVSGLDQPPGEARHQPQQQDDRDQAQSAAHA